MLTLIDGNSILFRAYYGVHSRLTRADGTATGAAFAFFNMMLPVFAAAKSDDVFVCVFDASRQTFRQKIYPEYKANRAETPADLISQSIMVRRGLAEMGVPVLCVPGVEADDVIATLATKNCAIADKTRIMTGDKDLMQLVSDCIFLYDGMKQKRIERAEVIEKFGVPPERVVDVQSLMGDSSDNVPGVHGIGPKKAAELINEFGTLDELYAHLDDIKNERTRKLLSESRDAAYISRELVTLKRDVDLSGLKLGPLHFNRAAALEFVKKEIESNSLYEKISKLFSETATTPTKFAFPNSACPVDAPTPNNKNTSSFFCDTPPCGHPSSQRGTESKMTFAKITTVAELEKFLSGVRDVIALDTETTGLDQMTAKMVGMSLAIDPSHGVYIPLRHRAAAGDLFGGDSVAPGQISIKDLYKKIWPILTDKKITKVGHNIKFDLHIMANEGWDIEKISPIDDTMLLSYALHGTLHSHGMDELALKYLNHQDITFASLFPPKTRDADMHFDELPIDTAYPYAAEDATVTMALYKLMRPQLDANEKLRELYEKCDRPLLMVLTMMERCGVLVNKTKLLQLSGVFHEQLTKISGEIFDLAGHEFNIASPKQLGTVLFDELHLPENKKRSTDADSLNDLIEHHEIIEKILNWRSIAKLAGTYADALPRQIGDDGRIHTTYLQTSTNTGRLSSRDPNLQNIPIKTELGEEIRKCFVAGAHKKLIAVDYSQIQLRLLADVADIKTFKDTFIAGADIHEQTARKIFNIPQTTIVPRDLRRAAKTVNFSIIYGISSIGLAAQLNVSHAQAADIINSYMAGLPEIKKYIDDTKEFAKENACVYTPWGRRIELPEVRNSRLRAYAMRAAINAPIQGYEADLMRRAMINVYNEIVVPNTDKIKLIMQVHDEMVFECDEKLAESFAEQIKNIMENVTKISVPLRADYVIAPFWGK
ncbi:MAG: DNA polymerase I [Alphaproteobacteria bacterium]|nr:DNA polymerase I [Alphaproteobacteria bacterium]